MNRRSVLSSLTAAGLSAFAGRGSAQQADARPLPIFEPWRYGAVADGKALDSPAINRAIDACTQAGGGIVYIRPGVYRSGTVILKSNVTLYVEAGAVILGSLDMRDYAGQAGPSERGDANKYHLIYARGEENVTLAGPGRLDGQGQTFWEPSGRAPLAPEDQWAEVTAHAWKKKASGRPSPMLEFVECRWLRIEGIRIENSAGWTLRPINCDNVVIEGVSIKNPNFGSNTDGLDLTGCQNVFVSNCSIDTGDDAICLKSENPYGPEPRLARNIVVTNCVLTTCCNGFKVGTATQGGFENITFSNSVIYNREGEFKDRVIAGIALEIVDGGWIDGVVITGIRMQRTRTPIFIRLGDRSRPHTYPQNGIRGVMIENIHASESLLASSIMGIPGHAIEDVTIANVNIENVLPSREGWPQLSLAEKEKGYPEARMFGMMPVYGFYARHVQGLTLRSLSLHSTNQENRPALCLEDVHAGRIENLTASTITGPEPLVKLKNASAVSILNSTAPKSTASFLQVEGDTSDILVANCDLRKTATVLTSASLTNVVDLHNNILSSGKV